MKITYTHNPLRSIIEVDDTDIKRIRQALEVEELWGIVYGAKHQLDTIKNYNPVKAETILSDAHIDVYSEIDRCLPYYLESLTGSHCGDCTSIATSCEKCQVEGMLGINTIDGMNKSMGNRISSLFRDNMTIHQVISEYEESIKIPFEESVGDKAWLNAHHPKWEQTRIDTLKWLKAYRHAHFPIEQ